MTFQVKPVSASWSKSYKEEIRKQFLSHTRNEFVLESRLQELETEIAELKKQLEVAHRRIAHQVEQVDQASDSIMGVIGHKVEALAESVASRETERALDDFDIHQYECEIGDMLDERLPEGLDDERRSEDLKAAVSELLANATIKIELE